MRIKLSDLRKIIREEAALLDEVPRMDPESLEVDRDAMTWSAMGKKSREGELGDEEQQVTGKLVPHGGRFLPKPEPAFGYGEEEGPGSMRSLTGQVSAQLKDAIDDLMGPAPEGVSKARATKGKEMGKALKKVLDAAEKLDDEPKAAIEAAVAEILGIKLGFDVQMP